MATRLATLFGKTLRDAPAEAELPSHQLMLRAGLVQPVVSGVFAFLPLGWAVVRRIEQIIREEMDREGGQEVILPILTPSELWEQTGRLQVMDEILFKTTDRRGRELVLGPTHEELMTDLVGRNLQSYRDLPMRPYQIQAKFRDEARPRGGTIRTRQFTMMDLYSYDADDAGLQASYDAMYRAYTRVFERCAVPTVAVQADSGAMGGTMSQEFMFRTDVGEDTIIACDGCGYAANAERAEFVRASRPAAEPLPAEEVATPGRRTIEEVSSFLGISAADTLKAVLYMADNEPLYVAIRGDLDVNEVKLANVTKVKALRPMTDEELRAAGIVAGYASPVGAEDIRIVADVSATEEANLVAGANKPAAHVRNVNYGRDWQAATVADIALARAGDACPRCGSSLSESRAIEMGHIFQQGTKYTEALGASFLDAEGNQRPAIMGAYGIGVERLFAGVIEANHDERGIIWPPELAPYDAHVVVLNADRPGVGEAAQQLVNALESAGLRVLYDDRAESAGVKFNDADLLGMPVRATVSPRNVEQNAVELRDRRSSETSLVSLEQAVAAVRGMLS